MSTDYFLTNEEKERRKKRRMDEPSVVNIHPSTCLQSEILSAASPVEHSQLVTDDLRSVPTSNEIDHVRIFFVTILSPIVS
jgi:hypothetical protein